MTRDGPGLARNPTGQPRKLRNPELRAQLLDTLTITRNPTSAALAAGIHPDTEKRWRDRGRTEHDRLTNPDEQPDPQETDFLDYYRDSQAALHTAAMLAGDAVRAALVDRTITKDRAFNRIDGQGNVVEQRTQREIVTVLPDGRFALRVLERVLPEQWAPLSRLELTGRDGGPLAVSVDIALLDAVGERIVARHALDVSSEVVDDDEPAPPPTVGPRRTIPGVDDGVW